MNATSTILPPIPDLITGQRILARLPMANPMEAHQEIDRVLESLAQTPLETNAYFELLEQLRTPAMAVQTNLARRIGSLPLPLDDAEERVFSLISHCWLKLSAAYKYCFLRTPANDAKAAVMLQRSLVHLALVIREYYRARREIPRGLWLNVHELAGLAESCGIADEPVWDKLSEPGRQTSCAATYAALLLADLSGPFGLSARDQNLVWRWTLHWALLTRVRHFEADEPLPSYVIDLAQDAPLVGAPSTSRTDTLRCLDTSRLAAQVRLVAHQLQTRASPAEIGLGEDCSAGQCRRLLEHLSGPWGQAHAPRRYPRHRGDASAVVAAGFDTIHYFISGKEFAAPTSAPERSHAAYETLFAFRHMVDPEKPLEFQQERMERKGYLTEQWSIIDHSANGMRLCRSAVGRRVQHGQLLAISTSLEHPFFLAHITWLMQESSGELIAGIEALAAAPRAATVRVITQAEAHRQPYAPALLLPAVSAEELPETLIVPPDTYRALRVVEVIVDDATQQYELMHVINAGPDYERVSFAPAPPADPVR